MKKLLLGILFAAFILGCPGVVAAQPEPTRQVELYLKPGVDFRQFRSIAKDLSLSIQPATFWSVENADPFLRQRIREIAGRSIKKQGFDVVDATVADLTVKIIITQWGRFQNSKDLNLLEYLDMEVRAYSGVTGDLLMKTTGSYSRVDPLENSADKINEAFESIMDEALASMRVKPVTPAAGKQ